MVGICYLHEWWSFTVNVGKYAIHGLFGYGFLEAVENIVGIVDLMLKKTCTQFLPLSRWLFAFVAKRDG